MTTSRRDRDVQDSHRTDLADRDLVGLVSVAPALVGRAVVQEPVALGHRRST